MKRRSFLLCCSGRMSDAAIARLCIWGLGVDPPGLGHGDGPLQSDRRDVVPSMRRTDVEGQHRKLLALIALYVYTRWFGKKTAQSLRHHNFHNFFLNTLLKTT